VLLGTTVAGIAQLAGLLATLVVMLATESRWAAARLSD
jgi:hypothetical protein